MQMHKPEYSLGEKAQIEYLLKESMVNDMKQGDIHENNYQTKAKALRKTIKTDNVEYWKTIQELSEMDY